MSLSLIPPKDSPIEFWRENSNLLYLKVKHTAKYEFIKVIKNAIVLLLFPLFASLEQRSTNERCFRQTSSRMTLENNDIQTIISVVFNKIFAHHVKFMRQNYGLKVTPVTTNNSRRARMVVQLP